MRRHAYSSRQRAEEVLKEALGGGDRSAISDPSEKPSDKRRRQRSFWSLLHEFLSLLKPQRGLTIYALVMAMIATLLRLVPPAATKFIIDSVIGDVPLPPMLTELGLSRDNRVTLLAWMLGGVTVLSLARAAIQLSGRWAATKVTKRLQLSVRREAFDHAVRLPLHRVYALKSGGAASLLREDAGNVGELVFGLLFNPWRAIIQLIGSLCVLAFVDWRLLAGGLLLLPLVYFTHRTWIARIRPLYRAARKIRQNVDAQTTETFGGMRVVRAFGQQRGEAGRFIRGNNLLIRQELRVWWSARLIELLWELVVPVATVALLWYGGQQVMSGRLSLGDLMMFLVYLVMLLEPLAVLAESAASLQGGLSALDRVLDLMNEPREMASDRPLAQVDRPAVRGEIDLDHVSFRYPGTETRVIDELTLHVGAGQTVAIVGPSGAGKTTLCNLVARFYDPDAGRVLLDGRDLRDYAVESYRGLLGIVEQDVFLFDGTIAENLAFGRSSATDEEIREAARLANAEEFIGRMANGYDTIIGERGVKLSGGQRQRLAIARAILSDPKILILDEATSNLDTDSEQLIQRSLAALMRNRTTFVIAHRLSTIRHADLIVVMERGQILEAGSHDELYAASTQYRRLVLQQAGGTLDGSSAEK